LRYEGGFRDPLLEAIIRSLMVEMQAPTRYGALLADGLASTLVARLIHKYSGLNCDSSPAVSDMGLTRRYSSVAERFEVDGANAARDFLRSRGTAQPDIDIVWTAIALHTTPGIPRHMHPVISLVTAGVEMDVLGLNYREFSDAERAAAIKAHPRGAQFKEDIIQALYEGIKGKPDMTFGNVKADVLADKDPEFRRANFCRVIRESDWPA
jgi:hypothetical protein